MKIEGEILISWEYTPPKHKKMMQYLIPILLGIAWVASSFIFGKWAKYLKSGGMMLLMLLVGLAMKGFKAQKYQFTTRGVFVFDSGKKQWKRLGYWEEFIDYERGEGYIKLKKNGLFGVKSLYFNKDFGDFLKVLEIVNENIFKHRSI